MKTYSKYFFFSAGICTAFLISMLISFGENNNKENRNTKRIDDRIFHKWYAPQLPKRMSFAGEEVPLERWDVQERFDRELLFNYYFQNNVLFMLKLSNRYFPIIEERLKANGVPDDFKYLCVAESNLLNAISRSGAVGFWQFMSYTAPGYNLEINDQVDQRYDVVRSTDAACKYLKKAYSQFGSWTAAAASYNCGMGGYSRNAAFQRTSNYYYLLLPEETNRYIFRILTFKHLLENAEEMGFVVHQEDVYPEITASAVTVNNSIPDLTQFAIDNGTSYKMLKLLNPWLRGKSLTVKPGKSYVVRLPHPLFP